jgi:predicted glutamine amidotransferase
MCEVLAVRFPEPRPFAAIAGWARAMEFYGSGRFGWGVAWRDATGGDGAGTGAAGAGTGTVRAHLDTGQLADDPAVTGWLARVESAEFLVHSRRPTLLSTIQLADTQPFVTRDGDLAFCHNGLFAGREAYRSQYAGRLAGGADSEIGFRMLEDQRAAGVPVTDALGLVHAKLGGNANLATLAADGTISLFSSHETNRLFTFGYGDARVAATELHSPDDSLFRLVFRDAPVADRAVVGEGVIL